MSADQSKADEDVKILFGEIKHHTLDPEVRKMLVNGRFRNEDSIFYSGPLFTCF